MQPQNDDAATDPDTWSSVIWSCSSSSSSHCGSGSGCGSGSCSGSVSHSSVYTLIEDAIIIKKYTLFTYYIYNINFKISYCLVTLKK